ncbi:MAG: hypothetical protein COA57_11060 [Flavobacteriales bacterium]|nr:MAG: hypothetical protein COA57_11060 [Flavobacteriales bacterium]
MVGSILIYNAQSSKEETNIHYRAEASLMPAIKGCVFKTVFGEESSAFHSSYKTPEKVEHSITDGLNWIAKAQHSGGGWGAGSHARQHIIDPHEVNADPATTSMVAMAIMRSGSTINSGPYSNQLKKALEYILKEVERSSQNNNRITDETGTQIQTKLGANIDAVLATQFLTNIVDELDYDPALKKRVMKSLNVCVDKVQNLQASDGRTKGGGWAGVLQSGLANNALEAAQTKGAKVDAAILEKSREYQNSNFNAKSGEVNTTDGAGVVLYSVSSSVRASAKQAREVKEDIAKAKAEGKIEPDAEVSEETLNRIGYSKDKAMKANTSYQVYSSAKTVAQNDKVIRGFGNNGGEEFLSFLQTGESMIINKDNDWKNWYDNVSGRLLNIQNNNGSWNGHHCITSPVFCTAISILILTVNNDIDKLTMIGQN